MLSVVDLPIKKRCWKSITNRATIIGKCRAKTGPLRRLKYVPSFLAINFGDQLAFLSFPAARVRALSARNSIKALARAIIASFRPSSAPVALSRHRSNIESDGGRVRARKRHRRQTLSGRGNMGRMGRFYESRVGRKLIHCRPRCDCAMGRHTWDVGSWRLGKNTHWICT